MSAHLQTLMGAFRSEYLGFICGHADLPDADLADARSILESSDNSPRHADEFERHFAALLGGGEAVSFASGRMAFHAVLKALGIGKGDEVILTGFTCSVMANAVWRIGATPVYADIEPSTFGTDPRDLPRKVSTRTRVVVAQHSFGLPCAIDEIAAWCREKNLPLIEDCALTLDSRLDGKLAGTWGDAAIFSTDHSKPLNTLTGGLLHTARPDLAFRVRTIQRAAPSLEPAHQHRLFNRLTIERRYFDQRRYGLGTLLAKLQGARRRFKERLIGKREYTLLEADFKPRIAANAYAYPAQMPAFLARIGISELARWPRIREDRRTSLAALLRIAREHGIANDLPAAYTDPRRDITPLRLAWVPSQNLHLREKLRRYVDADWFWFPEPVSFSPQGPEDFGYKPGTCPIAERTGTQILNWPCVAPHPDQGRITRLFAKALAR
jgi:dTDP-4-amino-4,6-dideoxygalactose transaminase